ncbi:hypothetical protein [Lysobacter antibioticus]|uniref:hypothetical protein n=1 Tax=Lysobacter antibioticus TaxID=84531 RepID=UPI0003496A55|nr:hypothetical protein [Lysobacter antibioticus]
MADGAGKKIAEQKRPFHKGRGKGPPFVQIYHRITDSDEFGQLSGNALKLLLEVARQYRPGRNGDLSVPWSLLRDRGWRSQGTVADAKQELLERGWMIETRKGGKNKCSLYALTWYPIDASEKHQEPPTVTALDLWKSK